MRGSLHKPSAHLHKRQNPPCHYPPPPTAPKHPAVASAYQRLLRLHGLETERLLLPLLLLQLKGDGH